MGEIKYIEATPRRLALKGRGELRDQPRLARSRPLPEGPRREVAGPPSGATCGLAGGQWSRVEPLIVERLVKRGVAVTVYDHGED
jgi:hypothetical protein